jgi:hypothetical protein
MGDDEANHVTPQQFWQSVRDREATEQHIIAVYGTPQGRAAVKDAAVLVARCPARKRKCLLLHAWRTPDGVLFYQPPYKTAPDVNVATSEPDARARHTTDGDNHWRATAGTLDSLRGWGPEAVLHLRCDHIQTTVAFDDLVAKADAATPGQPVRVYL